MVATAPLTLPIYQTNILTLTHRPAVTMFRYLTSYAALLRRSIFPRPGDRPLQLTLFITSLCNASCAHCFYADRLNADGDLSLDQVRALSRALGPLFSLSLSGGEPFLSPLLAETCLLFARHNSVRRIQIPTNGLLPENIARTTEQILRGTAAEVTVALSVDGLEKTHDRIRGREGCFGKVRETYRLLSGMKGSHRKLRLVTNTAISNLNLEDIPALMALLRNEWTALDSVNWDWVRGQPADPDVSLPPVSRLRALKPTLLSAKAHFLRRSAGWAWAALELAFRDYLFDLDLRTLSERRQVVPCRAPAIHRVVYANGDCSFCETLPSFGNFAREGPAGLLGGKKAERMEREARAGNCFCAHGCHQPFNSLLDPKSWPRILLRLGRV